MQRCGAWQSPPWATSWLLGVMTAPYAGGLHLMLGSECDAHWSDSAQGSCGH